MQSTIIREAWTHLLYVIALDRQKYTLYIYYGLHNALQYEKGVLGLVRCLNVDKTTKPHCAARTVHKQAAGLRQLQLIGCVPCSTPQGTHAFLAWK